MVKRLNKDTPIVDRVLDILDDKEDDKPEESKG